MSRLACALLLALVGCKSTRGNDVLPFVQPSSTAPADRVVTVTERLNFSPPCLVINLGQTVEWDNPTGKPINVTSASVRGNPPELYSPSLLASAAAWRHTFDTAGRVDYFDQNGAGGAAIDPYYGTRTTSGTASAVGTICVRDASGGGCLELCCIKAGPAEQCGGRACDVPDDPEIAYGFCAAGGTTVLDAASFD